MMLFLIPSTLPFPPFGSLHSFQPPSSHYSHQHWQPREGFAYSEGQDRGGYQDPNKHSPAPLADYHHQQGHYDPYSQNPQHVLSHYGDGGHEGYR